MRGVGTNSRAIGALVASNDAASWADVSSRTRALANAHALQQAQPMGSRTSVRLAFREVAGGVMPFTSDADSGRVDELGSLRQRSLPRQRIRVTFA